MSSYQIYTCHDHKKTCAAAKILGNLHFLFSIIIFFFGGGGGVPIKFW